MNHISPELMARAASFFKVVGDEKRMKILCAISKDELCVNDIAAAVDMTKSAVSHQLRVLRENNLVKFEKKGKHAYYSLADDHVKEILDVALEHINE
jgi:ArsR family transcriptional regulator